MKKIAIIGGGISGIAAAYFLLEKGYHVEIVEKSSTLGGRVGSTKLGEKTIDLGGKNIGRQYHLFRQFVRDMGNYDYEFFGINSSTVQNGRIITFDSQKKIGSIFNLIKLIGIIDFLKFSSLAIKVKSLPENGFLGSEYFCALSESKDYQNITSYFGQRFCRSFLRPMTIRMNGCEPDQYYMGNFGTNIKMILDKFDQLKDGVEPVIQTFQDKVDTLTNTVVTSIALHKNNKIGLLLKTDNEIREKDYDFAVFCTPAPISAEILEQSLPEVSSILRKIQYAPVALAVVKYNRPIFNSKIRALTFSEEAPLSNAGGYGINDLDTIRYTFSGRVAKQTIDETMRGSDVITIGENILNQYIKVSKNERLGYAYKYFKLGLCSYAPYHHQLIHNLEEQLIPHKRIAIAGDFMKGASIEACFKSAQDAVKKVQLIGA